LERKKEKGKEIPIAFLSLSLLFFLRWEKILRIPDDACAEERSEEKRRELKKQNDRFS